MPIRPFLQGQAFDPETTEAMGRAFQRAQSSLGLNDGNAAATEMVAMAIITAAGMGARDADELYEAALDKLNWEPVQEPVQENPRVRRWQMRAEECRTLADIAKAKEARESLLSVADGYDRLVEQAKNSLPPAGPVRSSGEASGSEPG